MDLRAVIFVPALVGSVIFGFVFALYAAHYYLTVLQSTGSGSKEVVWVNEPIIDHFWKVFYLTWLIGLWLGPAWVLGRVSAAGSDAVWFRYVVPVAVLWVCYPVSQLSSLAGPSIWLPLIPDVFGRLARKPAVVLGFFGLSGATLAGFGLAFHWVFNAPGLVWLFVGSPLLVVTGLLYARLLGRLAFVLMFTKSVLSRKRKRKRARSADAPRDDGRVPGGGTGEEAEDSGHVFTQPSDLPPINTPDEGPLSGYDVTVEDHRPKPRKRVVAEVAGSDPPPRSKADSPPHEGKTSPPRRGSEDDEDATPYGVNEPEVQPEERAPVDVVKPSAVEMQLLNRDDAPRPPKQVWTGEIFAFLVQPGTVTVILMLSAMCVGVGGMVRIAREFNPVAAGP
ncbi:MAG: hypothetical protein JWO38_1905 [Gemmataceae bacterium]|nr:hypothetical protein [Gemmataceae bacterium]